jgi:hypothetical protein
MAHRPIIKLGPFWSSFSRPRTDRELLGTIQQGAAIGALARCEDGTYMQINGDVETQLNASRVEAALRAAQPRGKRGATAARPTYKVDARAAVADAPDAPVRTTAVTTPTVTVIKRRRIVIPPNGVDSAH